MMNKTQHAIQVFDRYAGLYQERFMDVSLYHASLDELISLMSPNAKLLELACGPGNITQYLLQQSPQLNILATDLAPKMLELAQQNNPNIRTQLLDCRDFLNLNQEFDVIVCGFGLPYISKEDAIQLIADASKVLGKDGLLYLSTMEGDYEQSSWQGPSTGEGPKAFIHYHQADYLIDALEKNGFELCWIDRKIYKDAKGNRVIDLLLIADR